MIVYFTRPRIVRKSAVTKWVLFIVQHAQIGPCFDDPLGQYKHHVQFVFGLGRLLLGGISFAWNLTDCGQEVNLIRTGGIGEIPR